MTSPIAIIGAGISGLAAAHILQDAGRAVRLFEKSRGVSGRAATRTRSGFTYDHGAQYIKQGNAESTSFITERFRAPDLFDIRLPVWIFDGMGQIQAGDPALNAEPKWCYHSGISQLAKQMSAGLDITFETRITRLSLQQNGWTLFDAQNRTFSPFSQVLVTIPAPQASALLEASDINEALRTRAISLLEVARYAPLLSIMLGYTPVPQKRPYYALVNTDKAHTISWLAWEHEKGAARVPPGSGLLIAQMAPAYSQQHWETPDEALCQAVAAQVSQLLSEPLSDPYFTDVQRWRYALPSQKADAQQLNALTLPAGLAFCGDAFVGGRVHLALEHGIISARQLLT